MSYELYNCEFCHQGKYIYYFRTLPRKFDEPRKIDRRVRLCCVDCAIKHHFDLEEYESKSQAHIEEDKMRSGRLYYLQTGQVKPLWLGEQQFLINRLKVLQKERDNERAGVLIRERSVSSSDGNPNAKIKVLPPKLDLKLEREEIKSCRRTYEKLC